MQSPSIEKNAPFRPIQRTIVTWEFDAPYADTAITGKNRKCCNRATIFDLEPTISLGVGVIICAILSIEEGSPRRSPEGQSRHSEGAPITSTPPPLNACRT